MDAVKLTIKDLAEEDRPREKLLAKGSSALSNAELLAILIGSGNDRETAVELAQRILMSVDNNLNSLGKIRINELIRDFRGIGEAKAISILAALELGRRRKLTEGIIVPKVTSSRAVYDMLHPLLGDLPHEEMWALLLNKSNKVIKKILLSKGGLTSTIFDVKIILKEAIDNLCSGIILCHNHPSGDPSPSESDIALTLKLKQAAILMDISLLDHVILCDGSYYSFRDEDEL